MVLGDTSILNSNAVSKHLKSYHAIKGMLEILSYFTSILTKLIKPTVFKEKSI